MNISIPGQALHIAAMMLHQDCNMDIPVCNVHNRSASNLTAPGPTQVRTGTPRLRSARVSSAREMVPDPSASKRLHARSSALLRHTDTHATPSAPVPGPCWRRAQPEHRPSEPRTPKCLKALPACPDSLSLAPDNVQHHASRGISFNAPSCHYARRQSACTQLSSCPLFPSCKAAVRLRPAAYPSMSPWFPSHKAAMWLRTGAPDPFS